MHNGKILAILHRDGAKTGKIGQLLNDKGYQLETRCIIAGDSLPSPSDYQGIVVFGGMMSANDCQTIPAIAEEIQWINQVIAAKVPYLGICLGAQLLARALGAGVNRQCEQSAEIGYHLVSPTPAGQAMFPAEGMRFYQWHIEGFSLPNDCECLAKSDRFPNQAFRVNARTLGFQFHPEASREMIDMWIDLAPEYLTLTGAQSYKTQVELHRESDSVVTQWLHGLLDDWLRA